jgi:hypothetical protein
VPEMGGGGGVCSPELVVGGRLSLFGLWIN